MNNTESRVMNPGLHAISYDTNADLVSEFLSVLVAFG